jgi:glycerol-3-phosphate dehydrogenase
MKRSEMLQSLESEFDVIVIGGGITGVGAARDAAYRGLKVVLVEMNDLAYGTSSRSSKLVHGGLRYLENFEFGLVFEAVSERRTLMDIAPHLVEPLGFIFPVRKDSRRSAGVINLGMWVYDALALFRSPKIHRNLSPKQVKIEEPALDADNLKGAPLYYDCSTDDARLTVETALDAVANGATILTYTKATGFIKDDAGTIKGIDVEDVLTGTPLKIHGKTIINCTGPWSDDTRLMGEDGGTRYLRPTKGVHIVVDTSRLSINNAVVCFHPDDGRVLFAIPWGDRTYIGTTDTDYEESLEDLAATRHDVEYLIEAANAYFPSSQLTTEDVISTWAGVRPLVSEETPDASEQSESSVSREHSIRIDANGLITIAGGKLTTYRRMAKEVVGKAVGQLKKQGHSLTMNNRDTGTIPLIGAQDWPTGDNAKAQLVNQMVEQGQQRISQQTAQLLVDTYGVRGMEVVELVLKDSSLGNPLLPNSDRSEILAQVVFSVESELAQSINDVMIRRTQLFFKDRNQGLDCIESVADVMGDLLEWTPEQRTWHLESYREEVARSRRWQDA